jgi:anti-sigma B factor antagonist
MSIDISKEGDTVRLTPDGPLVGGECDDLMAIIADQIREGEMLFDVDLAQTDYLDSNGLGVLVVAAKTVRDSGGQVRVRNLSADLKPLFELTRLSEILRLDDDDIGGAGRLAPLSPRPSPLSDSAEVVKDDRTAI